jgi:hypothetical protein
LGYAWSAFAVMWAFWISFVIFLARPQKILPYWPLPTVDQGGTLLHPATAALVDVLLIALFGLQHSLMARPWFKQWWASSVPPAFERSTYVHMANLALFRTAMTGWKRKSMPSRRRSTVCHRSKGRANGGGNRRGPDGSARRADTCRRG